MVAVDKLGGLPPEILHGIEDTWLRAKKLRSDFLLVRGRIVAQRQAAVLEKRA